MLSYLRFCLLSLGTVLLASAQEPRVQVGGGSDASGLILNALGRMPYGGHYSTSTQANQRLASSMKVEGGRLVLSPDVAQPSYCSGATYQIFVAVAEQLSRRGDVRLPAEALQALLVRGQRDGEGIWGRWNANGPGTARLFAEAGLGRNFVSWSEARRGDFMKVWWNDEIGQREHGHSVIYLGTETTPDGGEGVLFWSSNQPDGYGRKVVPRQKIKWALFSRLENPEALARLGSLPKRDAYLAEMLTRPSTREEVMKMCRVRQ